MQRTFAINFKYLLPAVFIFVLEICIALFVRDKIVRPFIGDVLVVVLIYFAVRIFLNAPYLKIAIGVLLFACFIEILQYFDYVALLRLENNRVLSVMMGRTFEWLDFAAYFIGFVFILMIEKFLSGKQKRF